MTKTGLIGGTFDPVHKGHLRLAYEALDCCRLDEIIFIPAARPPHKGNVKVSGFRHRVKMLELAVEAEPRFLVSDLESRSNTLSYTYRTLRQLKKTNEGKKFYFIIGSDAFMEIESWKNWREVITATNYIIAVRPGSTSRNLCCFLERHNFSRLSENAWTVSGSGFSVEVLESDFVDVSSTDIRLRIAEENEWEQLLPHGVPEYIKTEKLYF